MSWKPATRRGLSDKENSMPKWTPAELEQIRERIRQIGLRREASQPECVVPHPPPIYDEIYFQGVAWLDSLSYTDNWDPPED
jgi:hypothetical protein